MDTNTIQIHYIIIIIIIIALVIATIISTIFYNINLAIVFIIINLAIIIYIIINTNDNINDMDYEQADYYITIHDYQHIIDTIIIRELQNRDSDNTTLSITSL